MSSKGISEMIAVVLLIAFTVAVGGIVSIWLTGFMSITQESVEASSTNQTKCAGTYIDVISVTSSGVIITNRGSQDISTIQCYTSDGTAIPQDEPSPGFGGLSSGVSNSTTWGRGGNTSILCAGKCISIGVTGECKSGQGCWKT